MAPLGVYKRPNLLRLLFSSTNTNLPRNMITKQRSQRYLRTWLLRQRVIRCSNEQTHERCRSTWLIGLDSRLTPVPALGTPCTYKICFASSYVELSRDYIASTRLTFLTSWLPSYYDTYVIPQYLTRAVGCENSLRAVAAKSRSHTQSLHINLFF
jgi:hypothetical protein